MLSERYKKVLWIGYVAITLFVIFYIVILVQRWNTEEQPEEETISKVFDESENNSKQKNVGISDDKRNKIVESLRKKRTHPSDKPPPPTRNLERYKKEKTEKLLDVLEKTKSTFEKRDILEVLKDRKDPSVVEPLTDMLKEEKNKSCRKEIVVALISTGSKSARTELWRLGYIKDKDSTTPTIIPSTTPNYITDLASKKEINEAEIEQVFRDVRTARNNPESTIKLMFNVLRSDKNKLYRRASLVLKQLSMDKDLPILPKTATSAQAKKLANEWEEKINKKFKKE